MVRAVTPVFEPHKYIHDKEIYYRMHTTAEPADTTECQPMVVEWTFHNRSDKYHTRDQPKSFM